MSSSQALLELHHHRVLSPLVFYSKDCRAIRPALL